MPRRSEYASARLLTALVVATAIFRNRTTIRAQLSSLLVLFQRALKAIHVATLVLSHISTDAVTYFHPLPPALANRRGLRTQPPPPRSLRRLLRLLSSEDGLSILCNLAGGAARGVTRELCPRPERTQDSPANIQNQLPQILDAFAAPSGQRVISNIVSTAVREGVKSLIKHQRPPPGQRPWPDVVADAVLSDRGRQLTIDLATNVSRTVIPLMMTAPEQTPSVVTVSPTASPLTKRPLSYRGCDSPVTRQLVMSVMHAQGSTGLVERLALLAIRDKALVREVVRVVVGEAVQTYLKTKAEIGREGRNSDEEGMQKSLWKALISSAVVDLKRALLTRAKNTNPGWLVF